MKDNSILGNRGELANSLTAVAAGILTNILYDMLSGNYFEGQITEKTVEIFAVGKYAVWLQVIGVIGIFSLLWGFLVWVVPCIIRVVELIRIQNKPRINYKMVMDAYWDFKAGASKIQQQVGQFYCVSTIQSNAEASAEIDETYRMLQNEIGKQVNSSYAVIFCDMCQLILGFHSVFCSGKPGSENIIKESFRLGSTFHDIGTKISPYEYLAVLDTARSILDLTHQKLHPSSEGVVESDYKTAVKQVDELKSLPGRLLGSRVRTDG